MQCCCVKFIAKSCLLILLAIVLPKHHVLAADVNDIYLQQLWRNMNTTADPCEDFYEYACGNWTNNYVSKEYVDMPGYMDKKVDGQLFVLMQAHRNKSGIYEKVWKYYQSCEQLKSPALNYYLKELELELNFTWPIFRQDWTKPWANETNFDWLSTIAALRAYGLNGVFITQHINMRLTNGSHFIMEIYQHQPRTALRQKDVQQIFINFGMTEEQSANVTRQIMAFENEMRNRTLSNFKADAAYDEAYYRNSFRELRMQELMDKVPAIDWQKYFNGVLGYEVQPEKELIQAFALNLKYFEQLLKILGNTSNETICYYIMLQFMYQLNEDLPNVKDTYTLRCVNHVRGYMPLAMNFMYEEHIYKAKRAVSDAALLRIFDNLRNNFVQLVEQDNRLDLNSTERAYILTELRTMRLKIGNVPRQLSQSFVEQFYENITIDSSNFYGNQLQLLKLGTRLKQAMLRNEPIPSDRHFYHYDPETSSSSSPFKIFENAILVPYGYLQLPFFETDMDLLLQYSLLGFILAHEIMHAYDLFHIVYDQHGSYSDLGLAILSQHYLEFISCFAQHPSESLSENIADVSGLRLVYKTYFDDVVNNLSEVGALHSKLTSYSGLSEQQLFFINSVQFLCANILEISILDAKSHSLDLQHDRHDVRVRQNWANFEEFAVAFNCTAGTDMHPEKMCRLW